MKIIHIIILVSLQVIILYGCNGASEGGIKTTPVKADTLGYSFLTYTKDSSDNNPVVISLRYPQIKGNDKKTEKTINDLILEIIYSPVFEEAAEVKNGEELYSGIRAEYDSVVNNFSDYNIHWELEREIEPVYNDTVYFGFKYYEFQFTGGAHPMTTINYYMISRNTGEILNPEDIFTEEEITRLREEAEKEFRGKYNIPDNQSYSEAGFEFENDEFELSDNFALTYSGIVFYYNPYEIAPYVRGATIITLQNRKN